MIAMGFPRIVRRRLHYIPPSSHPPFYNFISKDCSESPREIVMNPGRRAPEEEREYTSVHYTRRPANTSERAIFPY